MSTDPVQLATVQVSVTVTNFHHIGGTHSFSKADVVLSNNGNGAASQAGTNDPIVINQAVNIGIVLNAPTGDKYTYSPVGIAFKEGNSTDPLGNSAFPTRTIVSNKTGAQMVLSDANPTANSFEFGVVVQRSDGLLSVIDPQIKNSGTN